MADKLEPTSVPGVFRAHTKECGGLLTRCRCPYTVISRHRGKPRKQTVATFGEARELKGRRESGDRRPVSSIRFGSYYKGWLPTYTGRTSQGFTETSRDEYRRVFERWMLPRWRTWKLIDPEPKDVRKLFADMRAQGASTSQIKKARTAGSAMYATAAEEGAVRSNPFQGVRIPAPPEGDFEDDEEKIKAMSREELGWLLGAIPEDHLLFFEFMAHTGLRISEAMGLRWEHVDLAAGRLRVREQVYRGKRKKLKTKKGRRDLPLSPGMVSRLLAHRASSYEGERASVFPSKGKLRRTKEGFAFPFDSKSLGVHVLTPAREAVGLPWVTFHTFRHTCASLLFAGGKNVKQVQEWLGHAGPSFTLREYIHLMDEGVGSAVFLDDVVAPAGSPQGNSRATPGQHHVRNQPQTSRPRSGAKPRSRANSR